MGEMRKFWLLRIDVEETGNLRGCLKMETRIFEPPRCPACGKLLEEVFENEYNTYIFDSVSATYKKHEWKGEIEIFCPYCNAKLYDVFPNGVCNYVSNHGSRC